MSEDTLHSIYPHNPPGIVKHSQFSLIMQIAIKQNLP